jgi:hypothetical protein
MKIIPIEDHEDLLFAIVLSIKSFVVFWDVGIVDKKNKNGRLGLN